MNGHPKTISNPIPDHERINESLISHFEKRCLSWMAARMPQWVTPDRLTACGVLGSFIIFAGYLFTRRSPGFLFLASLGFCLQWFGDSLDGTLARFRKIERPHYGYFIDHIVDTGSIVLIFIGIGLSPYVRLDLALFASCSYLALSIYVYLVTSVSEVFRFDFARLGPTEMRLLAILANILVFFLGNPLVQIPLVSVTLTAYDLVAMSFALFGFFIFVFFSYGTATSFAKLDRAAHKRKVKTSPQVFLPDKG